MIILGAWDELDTEISVDVDTSDLDGLQSLDDPYGIFDDIANYAVDLSEAVHNGSKRGVEEIAVRNRSFQQQIIAEVCDNPSGMLASSIQEEEGNNGYTFIVGTILNHIYPMSVEYGRSEVYPVRAKALAFYLNGELVFRKSVGRAEPRPFVAPAYEKTDDIAEELMLIEVNHAIAEID